MSSTIVSVIIQIISGIIGGNAVGAGMKNASLGNAGNTIAGIIGGLGGGQILNLLAPALVGAAGAGGTPDIGSMIGEFIGGGVGGAVLTAIVGLIRNAMAGQKVG